MTYASPYLLSLGLSKSRLSLVWVAGPLSGLVMQPIIGMISDKSTSKYGRRRPFMAMGTVAVAVCLLLLGWTQEVVGWFISETELVGFVCERVREKARKLIEVYLQRREVTFLKTQLDTAQKDKEDCQQRLQAVKDSAKKSLESSAKRSILRTSAPVINLIRRFTALTTSSMPWIP